MLLLLELSLIPSDKDEELDENTNGLVEDEELLLADGLVDEKLVCTADDDEFDTLLELLDEKDIDELEELIELLPAYGHKGESTLSSTFIVHPSLSLTVIHKVDRVYADTSSTENIELQLGEVTGSGSICFSYIN